LPANRNGSRDEQAKQEQAMTLALSAWDLERTRQERPDTPRSRIVLLRTHKQLQAALEERHNIHPAKRTQIKICEEGRGACLLIHGSLGSPADLSGLADHLHRSGLNVYSLLLPGHGSPGEGPPRVMWQACLQEVKLRFALLQRVSKRVSVVGCGFGAALAIHLAAKSQISSLVLLAPALIPRVTFFERTLFRLGLHRLPWILPRMGWSREVLGGMKRARAIISRLRVPIYGAQCEDDERISPLSLRVLQKNVRHKASRFRVFDSGGHAILDSHGSDTLFAEISKFIR